MNSNNNTVRNSPANVGFSRYNKSQSLSAQGHSEDFLRGMAYATQMALSTATSFVPGGAALGAGLNQIAGTGSAASQQAQSELNTSHQQMLEMFNLQQRAQMLTMQWNSASNVSKVIHDAQISTIRNVRAG